jgi:hypothetical protein
MENQDAEFIGIFVTVILFLVYAMIITAIDDRKKEKAKRKKEQEEAEEEIKRVKEEAETKIKRESEVVKLTIWFNDCLEPKDENVINSATLKFEQSNYEDIKEGFPVLTKEITEKYSFIEEFTGGEIMKALLRQIDLIYTLEEKGYFEELAIYDADHDLVERGDGVVTYTISQKEEVEAPKKRSRKISQKVKDLVWNRDGGKCVECGSNENLEFDHIIPHSKGGANTYRNIQLLCEPCNRSKSAKIG